jgi:3'(2'), 5'-bisphosphate nucleotidase
MNLNWIEPNKIINIIEIASQLILQIYNRNDYTVENKSDNSPLTEADKKANDFICNELRSLYPNIPIISEENKNDDYNIRSKYTYAWIIDPLDGTKEFINKNGEFTVNIGLIYINEPIAGFVNIPCQGITYWSIKDCGAWKKKYNIEESDIIETYSDNYYLNNKNNKKIVLASRSHMNNETKKYIEKLGDVELKNVGSSIKIIWIAENYADIYPRIAPTMEWDTCAADAILREMNGGCMKYNNENKYLTYNKENLLNPFFVAKKLEI